MTQPKSSTLCEYHVKLAPGNATSVPTELITRQVHTMDNLFPSATGKRQKCSVGKVASTDIESYEHIC